MSRKKPAALHRAGEGDLVTDRTARTVCLKAFGVKQLALASFRYDAGEIGADLHVHDEHADGFIVLDGELTLELGHGDGRTIERLGAGDVILVPPLVPHAFRNESDAEANFLNFHGPACGFDEYMRALRDGRRRAAQKFDQRPPGDDSLPASEAVIRRRADGPVRIDAGDGIGSIRIAELEVAPGVDGADEPCVDADRLQSYWVLDGALDVLLGEEWHRAGPGDYALIPPGNEFAYANKGDTAVRVIEIIAPAAVPSSG